MNLTFAKYQGTGNDFILIDHRKGGFETLSRAQIARLCDRRFGIGGDGLILMNSHPDYDFEMKNYNSDGGECSMCGNGARTLVQFAFDQGIRKDHYRFLASDGAHEARIAKNQVAIKMKNVSEIRQTPVGPVLDTGSPHLVIQKENLMTANIVHEGRTLRNSPMFTPSGINVNFVEPFGDEIFVRTYERGVEDETLSCGTGVIAAALIHGKTKVQTRGGTLEVQFNKTTDGQFQEIWLIGPAVRVFTGQLTLSEQ